MLVNLDQIEFYHGPPCQQSQSRLSSTRQELSATPYITEPMRHPLLLGPVLAPESPSLTLYANGSEPSTLQSYDQLATSVAEPCNIFDAELAKLHNGREGYQFSDIAAAAGNGSCLSNGKICHNNLELEVDGNDSAQCHSHPELGQRIMTADMQILAKTPLDFTKRPLCSSEQERFGGLATSTLPRVDHQPVQVFSQDLEHDHLPSAVDTDDSRSLCAISVPYSVVPRQASNASCNIAMSHASQGEPDELSILGTKSFCTSVVEPSCQDMAVESKQGDATGPTSSDGTDGGGQGEQTWHHRSDGRERSQGTGTSKGGVSLSSQMTTRSGRRCSASPEKQDTDSVKHYPSIAVVVPVTPWKRTRATRSTTRATACKRRLHHNQGSNGNNYTDGPSMDLSERSHKERQCRKKKRRYAVGPISYIGDCNSPVSDCAPENRNILGRAILTVQSDGSKPAYFFTFMPETAPSPLPDGSPSRHSRDDRLTSLGSSVTSSGKQRLYSSEENALLVRLKEREGMSWAEIAEYFPDRSASSIQVHYSTKLRRKTVVGSRKPQRRR